MAASGGLLLLRDPYYRVAYPVLKVPPSAAQAEARADVLTAIEARWSNEGITLVKFPRPGANAFQVWVADGTEAFVHPEDASVIDRWHWSTQLPAFLFELHAHLLADPRGTVVNGIAALSVVFMALTGAVLWWPARRGAFRLRGAIPVRLTAGRLLRSHAAVGAIGTLPILVFAITGAAIVFYDQTAAVMSRLLDAHAAVEPDASVPPRSAPSQSWREILRVLDRTFPDGDTVFYYPGHAGNARLMFRKRLPGEWHPNGRSYVLIDPFTAGVVQAIDARAQGVGTRVMHAVYPVHAAKVGGKGMVVLAFAAATALTWLGVSGAWTYLGRRSAKPSRLAKAA